MTHTVVFLTAVLLLVCIAGCGGVHVHPEFQIEWKSTEQKVKAYKGIDFKQVQEAFPSITRLGEHEQGGSIYQVFVPSAVPRKTELVYNAEPILGQGDGIGLLARFWGQKLTKILMRNNGLRSNATSMVCIK